ncbi:MAG TPA: ATP-dependent DNA helicase RecG [Candidatus Omnitrophota bacterium]|nr:ATP-dependent DNA helicase RecG [Candidatus Omnitrophota bacterium]HPT06581.1 ATP-dependent DNA helicase RecG [Candidatus Omnitrophota bacterium]
MEKSLITPVRYLKGIGPRREIILQKLAINTVEDILYYFPRRYEDRTHFVPIAQLQEGKVSTVTGTIIGKRERQSFKRRGFHILEVLIGDDSGRIFCIWFNQRYLLDYFKTGVTIIVYGKVERYAGHLQLTNPEFEIVSDGETEAGEEKLNIGRIVPIYTTPEGIGQRTMRKVIKHAIDEYARFVKDYVPVEIRKCNQLSDRAVALAQIHFPENAATQQQAYQRLSFDEFLFFQLPLAIRKLKRQQKKGIVHQTRGALVDQFIQGLPFNLTRSQTACLAEIEADLKSQHAMQRLLQGDVGCGKTIVATIACMMAAQGGHQTAFMVPTEILARQHFEKITSQTNRLRIVLLTGSLAQAEKDEIISRIERGLVDVVIGTHALLEASVKFKHLGLVVIDEQHKFGVGQRSLLPAKGQNPDVLIMTATPIPRTLAITLYGDMDISVINQVPPGRGLIHSLLLSHEEREKAFSICRNEIKKGHQAYIIYPVIDESIALDIAGATSMYHELKKGALKDCRLGLVHGRMKQKEQEEAMSAFKSGTLDVLVATTVLEVGVDVSNATCMIIENAERFGLSQLHQLRGRVGRGSAESVCVLVTHLNPEEEEAARLQALVKHTDGFHIAEEDLKLRGPGDFFGSRQHGLTALRIGNPLTQMQLLKRAHDEAVRIIRNDPNLAAEANALLKEKLLQRFPEYEKVVMVG